MSPSSIFANYWTTLTAKKTNKQQQKTTRREQTVTNFGKLWTGQNTYTVWDNGKTLSRETITHLQRPMLLLLTMSEFLETKAIDR